MMVVIDTNLLVSALWSSAGNPAKIISLISKGVITPLYNDEILDEYIRVISRDRFGFSQDEIKSLLREFMVSGISAKSFKSRIPLPDESDRVFYDMAVSNEVVLITGNKKHFPNEDFIFSPAEFLHMFGIL